MEGGPRSGIKNCFQFTSDISPECRICFLVYKWNPALKCFFCNVENNSVSFIPTQVPCLCVQHQNQNLHILIHAVKIVIRISNNSCLCSTCRKLYSCIKCAREIICNDQ